MASLRERRARRLFRKYVVYFVILVTAALLASGLSSLYFSYQENRTALLRLQQEKAKGAASRIKQYLQEIEHQIGWTHLPPSGIATTLDQRRLDYFKLLRQVPAITEVSRLDHNGRERLRISRLEISVIGGGADFSQDPRFLEARAGNTYFGPLYFRKETEPYMLIASADELREPGVTVVEVNLKFVWDVVSRIRFGQSGHAYIVDAHGQLISHPDISLVLRKTNFSALPQVRAALAGMPPLAGERTQGIITAHDRQGRAVQTAYTTIAPLGWLVFVEQLQAEALAPLYALMIRTGLLLLLGLVLAVSAGLILARKMVTPIQELRSGAVQIGAGVLSHRIDIHTGDELETLAEQFNQMAAQLQASYANLEQKVIERTRQLELANQTQARFLATASHDLRQPMHALGLFIAQLQNKVHAPETVEIVNQAQASVDALGELFDALLDISKLDAGVLIPHIQAFPVNTLLQRLENDFAPEARSKGLRFRTVPSRLFVCSDPVLLERILLNLVANAVRYTVRGGVLVGCRRRGPYALIEVWDTGTGIPEERQQEVFQEFYQLANPANAIAARDWASGLLLCNGLSACCSTESSFGPRRTRARGLPSRSRSAPPSPEPIAHPGLQWSATGSAVRS